MVSLAAYLTATGGPLLMLLFFKTLEKQPCKQETVQAEEWFSTKWTNKGTEINCVIREPCKPVLSENYLVQSFEKI